MQTPTEVSSLIHSLVQSHPKKRLTGAELSVFVRFSVPDFSPVAFQCKNLRDFIRRYVPDVTEAGRSGTDIVYSLRKLPQDESEPLLFDRSSTTAEVGRVDLREQPIQVQELVEDSQMQPRLIPQFVNVSAWRTFVSPSEAYHLYANGDTGELKVQTSDEPPLNLPWKRVSPVSSDKHLQIAKEFLETVEDEPTRQVLGAIVGRPKWWLEIQPELEKVNLRYRWNAFRRARLLEEFREALKSAGSPNLPILEQQKKALNQKTPHRQTESLIRKVALGTVNRMSPSDLRRLWLPLGSVMDTLEE